jgi:hypothetical protein
MIGLRHCDPVSKHLSIRSFADAVVVGRDPGNAGFVIGFGDPTVSSRAFTLVPSESGVHLSNTSTFSECEVFLQTGKSLSYWQSQPAIPVFNNADFRKFFLSPPREKVYENCNMRFEKMLNENVMEEMERLKLMELSPDLPAMKSHGVPELLAYLDGNLSKEDAVEQAKRNTRHYIKRQFTWFRGQIKDAVVLDMEDAYEKMRIDLGGWGL